MKGFGISQQVCFEYAKHMLAVPQLQGKRKSLFSKNVILKFLILWRSKHDIRVLKYNLLRKSQTLFAIERKRSRFSWTKTFGSDKDMKSPFLV